MLGTVVPMQTMNTNAAKPGDADGNDGTNTGAILAFGAITVAGIVAMHILDDVEEPKERQQPACKDPDNW